MNVGDNVVKCVVLLSEVAAFITLAVLVGTGHDSAITDALLAVGGAIVGTNLVPAVSRALASVKARDITDAGDAEDASHTSH